MCLTKHNHNIKTIAKLFIKLGLDWTNKKFYEIPSDENSEKIIEINTIEFFSLTDPELCKQLEELLKL